VSDLFMNLIHTCEFNDINPFDYLIELQKHPAVGEESCRLNAVELRRGAGPAPLE
jgi:hypothetical protein